MEHTAHHARHSRPDYQQRMGRLSIEPPSPSPPTGRTLNPDTRCAATPDAQTPFERDPLICRGCARTSAGRSVQLKSRTRTMPSRRINGAMLRACDIVIEVPPGFSGAYRMPAQMTKTLAELARARFLRKRDSIRPYESGAFSGAGGSRPPSHSARRWARSLAAWPGPISKRNGGLFQQLNPRDVIDVATRRSG